MPRSGRRLIRRPRVSVVSREISEEFGGGKIAEASQASAIVIGDKGVEIGVTFGVIAEPAVVSGPVWRHAVEMVTQAAVKALDHAVGLRSKGAGEAVRDGALDASKIKGMGARRLVFWLAFLVDGEAVSELGAVVGQDGMNHQREAVEEAGQEGGGGIGPAIGQDFKVDEAGGAVDRDIGVTAASIGSRYLTSIWMKPVGVSV
jgi:hypothetical protein